MEVLGALLEQIAFVENNPVETIILEAKGPSVNFTKTLQQDTMLSSMLEKSIDTRQNLLGYSTIWVWQNLDCLELRMLKSNMTSSSRSIKKLNKNWAESTIKGTASKKI